MSMEEKIALPAPLVIELMESMLQGTHGKSLAKDGRWLLALFERWVHAWTHMLDACNVGCHSFGSWWTACAPRGIWHVAIANVGCCSINPESKHVTIPMDLALKGLDAVLLACYHMTGFLLPKNLIGIVASPPCTTFSNFDSIRQTHRDYGQADRPAKSEMAKQHDAMVLHLLASLWPKIDNPFHVQGKTVVRDV